MDAERTVEMCRRLPPRGRACSDGQHSPEPEPPGGSSTTARAMIQGPSGKSTAMIAWSVPSRASLERAAARSTRPDRRSATGGVDGGLEAQRRPMFRKDQIDLKPENSRVLVVDNATKARLASVVDFGLAPEPMYMKTLAIEGRREDGRRALVRRVVNLPGRRNELGSPSLNEHGSRREDDAEWTTPGQTRSERTRFERTRFAEQGQ